MEKRKDIIDHQLDFHRQENDNTSALKKLDDLVYFLENSDLDSEMINQIQDRFNLVANRKKASLKNIEAFRKLDPGKVLSREDLVNNFELLLAQNPLDSKISKQYIQEKKVGGFSQLLVALVMVTLGFAMIVMPADGTFEMYTVYAFTTDDGVTIMDLISLLIVFSGVYLFIIAMIKIRNSKR